MLQFENVEKYYGSFLALQIPELTISEGTWWIKGENGSGKTTFLKMIAGIHPFKGSISLDNKISIHKQRQQFLKLVNYAEAEPVYPPFLTAKDLVKLYCKTKGGNVSYIQQLLEQLHVSEAYTQKIGSYSSGMVKKLSLALAFAGKPKLILLDEPLITIDAEAIDSICKIISNKQKEGISYIITSHQGIDPEKLVFTGKLIAAVKTISYN